MAEVDVSIETAARYLLRRVEERAKALEEGGDVARAAAVAARLGVPATFLVKPVEIVEDPELGLYVLSRQVGGRRYKVFLTREEVPVFMRACKLVAARKATVRSVQYHISKVYGFDETRITWKDVQAARLIALRRGGRIVYDLSRLLRVAKRIALVE
ncbi:MAG: hypothetical protein QW498_08390 [Thermofilum sp.]